VEDNRKSGRKKKRKTVQGRKEKGTGEKKKEFLQYLQKARDEGKKKLKKRDF